MSTRDRQPPARQKRTTVASRSTTSRSGSSRSASARSASARSGSARAGSSRPAASRSSTTVPRRTTARKPARIARVWRTGSSRRRFQVVVVFAVLCFALMAGRSAYIQVVHASSYRADGVAQRENYSTIAAARGTIFDRDGNELAITVPALSLYADPREIVDPAATAHVLAQMLGLDPASESELAARLGKKDQSFVYVQRFVDQDVADAVLSLNLSGVNGVTEPKRVQVAGGLARSVIGRTDPFGVGSTGLELQYDRVLKGQDGEMVQQKSGGRSLPGTSRVVSQARPGTDLVLTLDRSMQYQAEQALLARVNELGAKGGNVIIMDTATGEILSIASVRRGDDGVATVTAGNLSAVEAYEPGSVAKVFSVAATIDSGTATPDTVYQVPGVYVFDEGQEYEKTIKDAYPHEIQPMSLRDILVHSSNIGTLMAAGGVGSGKLHDYLASFGFGRPSSLDFPGESGGMLKSAANWRGSENATITYGYGFSTTSLQTVAAVNAVANHGMYVSPRLVRATIDEKGSEWETPAGDTHRVISEQSAATMADLMTGVVCEGTGTRAQLSGISVAGKTGTGYKVQANGTYENEDGSRAYFATFVGFLPAKDPKVTILVSIDEPDPSSRDRFGGTAAAPVFAALAQMAIHERSIEPTPGDTGCPSKG